MYKMWTEFELWLGMALRVEHITSRSQFCLFGGILEIPGGAVVWYLIGAGKYRLGPTGPSLDCISEIGSLVADWLSCMFPIWFGSCPTPCVYGEGGWNWVGLGWCPNWGAPVGGAIEVGGGASDDFWLGGNPGWYWLWTGWFWTGWPGIGGDNPGWDWRAGREIPACKFGMPGWPWGIPGGISGLEGIPGGIPGFVEAILGFGGMAGRVGMNPAPWDEGMPGWEGKALGCGMGAKLVGGTPGFGMGGGRTKPFPIPAGYGWWPFITGCPFMACFLMINKKFNKLSFELGPFSR